MPSSSKNIQEILNGRYRLDRLLGEGGMGSVYFARDVFEEGKVYALKILKQDGYHPVKKGGDQQRLHVAEILAAHLLGPEKQFPDTQKRHQ